MQGILCKAFQRYHVKKGVNWKWFWLILFYFMYDDVLNWFRSPFMLFLLVVVAGTLGYLQATGNLHYVKNAYSMVMFMWENLLKSSKHEKLEKKSDQKEK